VQKPGVHADNEPRAADHFRDLVERRALRRARSRHLARNILAAPALDLASPG
jgi:hypothetical protein